MPYFNPCLEAFVYLMGNRSFRNNLRIFFMGNVAANV